MNVCVCVCVCECVLFTFILLICVLILVTIVSYIPHPYEIIIALFNSYLKALKNLFGKELLHFKAQ